MIFLKVNKFRSSYSNSKSYPATNRLVIINSVVHVGLPSLLGVNFVLNVVQSLENFIFVVLIVSPT